MAHVLIVLFSLGWFTESSYAQFFKKKEVKEVDLPSTIVSDFRKTFPELTDWVSEQAIRYEIENAKGFSSNISLSLRNLPQAPKTRRRPDGTNTVSIELGDYQMWLHAWSNPIRARVLSQRGTSVIPPDHMFHPQPLPHIGNPFFPIRNLQLDFRSTVRGESWKQIQKSAFTLQNRGLSIAIVYRTTISPDVWTQIYTEDAVEQILLPSMVVRFEDGEVTEIFCEEGLDPKQAAKQLIDKWNKTDNKK